MHMHARVRPWNNVRAGYFALVMYLSNDIYTYVCIRFSLRTLGDRTHARKHCPGTSSSRCENSHRKVLGRRKKHARGIIIA